MTTKCCNVELLDKMQKLLQECLASNQPSALVLIERTLEMLEQYRANVDTAFSTWIRNNSELDSQQHRLCVTDIDWCIHQFGYTGDINGTRFINKFMLIEEKQHGAQVQFAQDDTLSCIDALLKRGLPESEKNKRANSAKIINKRGVKVTAQYYGLHYLQFSHTGPDDSTEILWDGKTISKQDLTRILKFELNPNTLRPLDTTSRRHHRNSILADCPLLYAPRIQYLDAQDKETDS